jgi:hypothetical protein
MCFHPYFHKTIKDRPAQFQNLQTNISVVDLFEVYSLFNTTLSFYSKLLHK